MRKLLIPALLLLVGCGPSNRVEERGASNRVEPGPSNPVARTNAEPGCNRGNPDAPVRLEVFSDYECPSCRAFYLQTMRSIFTDYADTGKVCVIYREFPTYQHAREAARLARASLRLGSAQWRLVADALYESQPDWSQTGNVEAVVASVLGPEDFAAVRKHLEDPTLDTLVDNDAIMGLQREVKGTPTSFITARGKTEKVDGALTYASMQRHLDALF
jgi:protein-disulfide isomerase